MILATSGASRLIGSLAIAAAVAGPAWPAWAQFTVAVEPPFASSYQVVDLGAVPGVPIHYGGLASPLFDRETVLVPMYNGQNIAAFETDAEGDPIVSTGRTFATVITTERTDGPFDALLDPLTGGFRPSRSTSTSTATARSMTRSSSSPPSRTP